MMNSFSYFNIKHIHPSSELTAISFLPSTYYIITGSNIGTITIYNINYQTKTYSLHSQHNNAHSSSILSFCVPPVKHNNTFFSCSADFRIKIWNVSSSEITLIDTLPSHQDNINKIIPFHLNNKEGIISCSFDCSIKVWKLEHNKYKEDTKLKEYGCVWSILQLNHSNSNILLSSCGSGMLCLWDLLSYQRVSIIRDIYTVCRNGLIELNNGYVAVSLSSPTGISIIDPTCSNIIKEIKDDEYITGCSSLCKLNDEMFVYAYDKKVVFISIDNNNIEYAINNNDIFGYSGCISIDKGKCVMISNIYHGVSVYVFN